MKKNIKKYPVPPAKLKLKQGHDDLESTMITGPMTMKEWKESKKTHKLGIPNESRQVVLLRVGIDTGCGGMLGPIFKDGTFEFIPIPAEPDSLGLTYSDAEGRHGRKLIDYFPNGRKVKMRDVLLHFDPEFETFTYGDPTAPKQSLKKLKEGDLLVFYAGLKGWDNCKTPPGLYIIGYFIVTHAGEYKDLKREKNLVHFAKNWHVLNNDTQGNISKNGHWNDLVLVKGSKGSLLLRNAVKISAKGIDRGRHPVFVLSPKMKKHFGTFTELNAIQRSIPRCVKKEFCEKAAEFVMSLK
jgi:hypothetical protein